MRTLGVSSLLFVMVQTLSLSVFAQKKSAEDYKVLAPYEAEAGLLFNEAEYLSGQSVLNQFENVIVINKAAKGTTAQTLNLYTNGQLALTTKVSTGREDVEVVKGAKKLVRKLFGTKGTTESHWRHTTSGFYSIKRVEGANYRSGESKFQMPYAMFFNDIRGLAVHQVPPDLSGGGEAAGEYALGTRASSGCVRVHKNTIRDIHDAVTRAGKGLVPVLDTKTGQQLLNADGSGKMAQGYRTLVIVQEVLD